MYYYLTLPRIRQLLLCGVLALFFLPATRAQTPTADGLETLRQRVVSEAVKGSAAASRARALAEELRADGSWPGIDYIDTSRTGFEHARHLDRMLVMARAYRQEGATTRGEVGILRAIQSSLEYWLDEDFISENWWWNQIGTPDRLVRLLLILDDQLSEEQVARASAIAGRANLEAWGARPGGDLIKIAGILGKRGLLEREPATVRRALDAMAGEIQLAIDRGTPDDLRGMQPDLSFHHRSDHVTSILSYGLGYAGAFADWAALLAGTDYAFPDTAIHLLVDFYLDGITQSMAFGRYPDPGALNRDLSRPGDLRPHGPEIAEELLIATDYRRGELERIARVRRGLPVSVRPSNSFFWSSEYLSHQRPAYFTSVRMFSSRNHSVEVPYNEEGLKNHHLADGANWLTRSGTEYLDIFPVFDYQKIPGTTVVQRAELPPPDSIQQAGLTEFVGGVSNGTYGAAAFDMSSPLDNLHARKAWFFFDAAYACLGAGISSRAADPVVTTLTQRWLSGAVEVGTAGRGTLRPEHGEQTLPEVNWVRHDSTAYLFPEPTRIHLRNRAATGSWYAINHQSDSPRDSLTGDVFSLWLDHGVQPRDAGYAYVVVPFSPRQPSPADSPLLILSNTPELQAVLHPTLGILQAVFYTPGEVELPGGLRVGTDRAGLVMLKLRDQVVTEITAADPTHRLPSMGVTVTAGGNPVTYVVLLPQGPYAGQSATLGEADLR